MESKGNVLTDFWAYCGVYEIPRNYALWSALGLLGAVVNRKVFIMQGDIPINAVTFILLVGPQGNGKSTAMRFAKSTFSKACPNIPLGPSQQSREDIVKFMASDDCVGYYEKLNEKGEKERVQYSPYHFFINEFKNFVSYNPSGMIAFLTDIYDEEVFKASTLVRGKEDIMHPAVNILACENPDWMIKNLKSETISGGFSRRINFIYETDRVEPRPRPQVTPEARAAIERVLKHCIRIKDMSGQVIWTKDAEVYYDDWYYKNRKIVSNDSIIAGYLQTKHIQMLKVCMLLIMGEYDVKYPLTLTAEVIQMALALMESPEKNLPKLFISAGRNELAAPQQRVIDLLEQHNGIMAEKEVLRLSGKDLNFAEQTGVLAFLTKTGQIYKGQYDDAGVKRWCYMTPTAYMKQGGKLS